MKIVISTQFMENYGAHDWDGSGECPQYWKCKGGSEFMVENVPLNIDYAEVVEMVRGQIEKDNDYCREYILSWTVESDNYLSWFEKSQLDYEGEISCAEPRIDYSDLNSQFA